MAFVARRNIEGKLVECQVISGHGTSSALQLSDQSDDDNDLGSMDTGYSNRSFKSPTVRYVSSKEQLQEDSEPENCYSYDESECSELTALGDLDSPNSTDSPDTYFDEYEGTGTDEPDDDEQISIETEVECSVSKQLVIEKTVLEEAEEEQQSPNNLDTLSMESFDVDTISSPRDEVRLLEQDNRSIGSFDVSTVCRESILGDLESIEVATICQPKQFEDNSSMVSTDVSTICKSKGGQSKVRTFDDTISLGSCNSVSMVRPKKKKQGIALDSISTSTFECQGQDTNRTYNVHSNAVRRDDCSSASTCSWTDMYGGALQPSDSRSNIVPSLSLNLSTTSSSGSTTYFRNCDDKKERQGQAYQEWVKRKERQKQEKKQAAIQERQKRDAETAMRQRLAKERYQEWIRQKELQQKKEASSSAKSSSSSASYQSNSSIPIVNKRQVSKETTEADKKRREQWERMKKMQEARERERVRLLRITQQKLEAQRKEKSDGAWKNWMKSVGKRAKPVPLNQGFDSLRGTIANIYINPNQWVSNIDTNDSRGNWFALCVSLKSFSLGFDYPTLRHNKMDPKQKKNIENRIENIIRRWRKHYRTVSRFV